MIYTTVVALVQPFTVLMVAMALAQLRLWRQHPEARAVLRWVTFPFVLLLLYCTGAVSYLAAACLEWQTPYLVHRPQDAQAIVVLGAGAVPSDEIVPVPQLTDSGIRRCLHAARLYHGGPDCPVIVCGGIVDPTHDAPPESDLMSELLVELGVPRESVYQDTTSMDTWENAVAAKQILDELNINRIILVTDATHLPRAVRCFRQQGLSVVPAGAHYQTAGFFVCPQQFLPTVEAAGDSEAVFHEGLGTAWFWLSGKR